MAKEESKRKVAITDDDISALKSAFADNEILLVAIRRLFTGNPITVEEAASITTAFKDEAVVRAFRRKIYPIRADDANIGEVSDYWYGTETEVIGKPIEEIQQIMKGKELARQKFETAMKLLEDPLNPGLKVDLSFDPMDFENDPLQIKLIARNRYLRSLETGLTMIKVIAGKKDESVDQAKKRMDLDSSK